MPSSPGPLKCSAERLQTKMHGGSYTPPQVSEPLRSISSKLTYSHQPEAQPPACAQLPPKHGGSYTPPSPPNVGDFSCPNYHQAAVDSTLSDGPGPGPRPPHSAPLSRLSLGDCYPGHGFYQDTRRWQP